MNKITTPNSEEDFKKKRVLEFNVSILMKCANIVQDGQQNKKYPYVRGYFLFIVWKYGLENWSALNEVMPAKQKRRLGVGEYLVF